jgi:hypothetical protein
METQDKPTKLTNLQLHLLKLFSRELPDEQLLEIQSLLSHYFAKKVDEEFEKLEKEKGWTAETYDQWLKEHMRTPYKK